MITIAITDARRTELESVASATASNAQQAVSKKPITATSRASTKSDMTVALSTSTTPISLTHRAEAGIPHERNSVAKPAAVTRVAQPR